MTENEQIQVIDDLLIGFDEMGFQPTTTVPDPEGFALSWRDRLLNILKGYRKVERGSWVVDAYNGDEIVRIPYVPHQHNEPYCSRCRGYALLDGGGDYVPSNFCPHCGAEMRGEEKCFFTQDVII